MTTPTKNTRSLGSKVLNSSLLFFLILTILVPITGVHVHKLASTLFLLLCIVHTLKYRNRFGTKSFLLLGVIWVSFLTGLFGMIMDQIPLILQLHKVISIVAVAFLAIHIYVFHRKLLH